MNSNSVVVIVGAGQAGGEVAIELRKLGYEGRIVLLGEEPQVPYKRPPLSKGFLMGSVAVENLYVASPNMLESRKIEFRGGVAVRSIDRNAKRVELVDGSQVQYDKLVLTTGGRARPLMLAGADAPNVFPLRTIADVDAIKPYCQPGKRLVVVGGGFIGLETAAVATKMGVKVTVLEGLPRVLARVTVPAVSTFFERVHREAGVDLRTSVQIDRLEGSPVKEVVLADGSRIETDFVVVGIGLIPNVELAQQAGLAVDNGIVVDEHAQTSDPDIFAAGDCANFPSGFFGRRLRLESVQNAAEQARAAAHGVAGRPQTYNPVPWFWSDQYDLKLQMVGLSTGFDEMVIRGNPETDRNFAVFYFGDGRLIAADTISRPQEFMVAKRLVADRAKLDPKQLQDETVPLKSLLPPAA